MTELELLTSIKKIIQHHLGDEVQIVLFGSRASGKSVDFSDYDIGLRTKKPLPPLTVARIYEEIEELPILRKVDIVDLSKVTKRFYATAMTHTRVI